jgi:hypothetical protein
MVKYVSSNTCVGVPIGTVNIVAGLYMSKAPSTSYAGGVNLSLTGVAHPLENCRLYYSQMVLDCCTSVCVLEATGLLHDCVCT